MRSLMAIVWLLRTLWKRDATIMPLCAQWSQQGPWSGVCGSPNWCNYKMEHRLPRLWVDDWHVPRSTGWWVTGVWVFHWYRDLWQRALFYFSYFVSRVISLKGTGCLNESFDWLMAWLYSAFDWKGWEVAGPSLTADKKLIWLIKTQLECVLGVQSRTLALQN